MRNAILTITLSSACLLAACDAPDAMADAERVVELEAEVDTLKVELANARLLSIAPPPGVELPGLTFREQGPPSALWTGKFNGQSILRAHVVKTILSAGGQPDPTQGCTLSWYQPDTTKDEMVLGLGCSMLAPFSLWQHYRDLWLSNGAVVLP